MSEFLVKLTGAILSFAMSCVVTAGGIFIYVESRFATNERVNYVEDKIDERKDDISEIKRKVERIYDHLLEETNANSN